MEKIFNHNYNKVYINCVEAAHQLEFNIKKENISDGTITYKIGTSLLSWGETFIIQVTSIDQNKTKVEVKSSSWQPIDWGKNDQNISDFYTTVNNLLK